MNECEEGTHLCIEVADCENAPGSYICTCPGGYALQDDDISCVGQYLLFTQHLIVQVI